MCVIIASNTKKCPEEWLDEGFKCNKDGAGIAWIEGGKVHFKKAMTLEPIKEIYQRIQPPYILHFRIASVGEVGLKLCHPFPINEGATLESEGEADAVLAHNGTYSKWKEECKVAVMRWKVKWPSGPWSDTRAFAWLCNLFGHNFADLLDEKIVIMNRKGVRFFGKYWQEEDGIQISNRTCIKYTPVKTYDYDRSGWRQGQVWNSIKGCYEDQASLPGITPAVTGDCTNFHCYDGWCYIMSEDRYHACMKCNSDGSKQLDKAFYTSR